MAVERDCNSCYYHVQAVSTGYFSRCKSCIQTEDLPRWSPLPDLNTYVEAIHERHEEESNV